MRGLVKGKSWLLLSLWVNLTVDKRQELNQLFCPEPESVQGVHPQGEFRAVVVVPV